jgi:hypothetical protein
MVESSEQKQTLESINSWLNAGSVLVAILSLIMSLLALNYASDSSRLAMMVSLRLELNRATDELISSIIAGPSDEEDFDLLFYRWDSTFSLARDAAQSGAMSQEHWRSTIDPLCELGKGIDFLMMSDGKARLDSLKEICDELA